MPSPKKLRPSPSPSASSLPPGTQMQGNDGHMYEVITYGKKQSHRWIKLPHFDYSVRIVDNGGVPFLVRLTNLSGKGFAYIYVYHDNNANNAEFLQQVSDDDYKLWKKIPYNNVFIGKDPEEPPIPTPKNSQEQNQNTGFFSKLTNFFKPSPSWWYGGNSVLLVSHQKNKPLYVFIGESIFSFSTPSQDKIISFTSPMGNNAVPYPYAIGQKYAYLFLERIYVSHSRLRDFDPDLQDPYDWFYQYTSNLSQEQIQAMQKHQKWQRDYRRRYSLPHFTLLHNRLW